MGIDRVELKDRAKELIRTAEPRPVLVGLAYVALVLLFSWLQSRVMGVNITMQEAERYLQYYASGNYEACLRYLEQMAPPSSAYGISTLLNLALSVVSAGFVIFLLNTIRSRAASFGNLLDGFSIFLRVIWLDILEGLLIFLWSLLLVVPGIIAAYRYRLALYLLIDHPELSVFQCLRESSRLMKGHKWELFVLDLSFLGWAILSALPVIGYAVQIWLTPYSGLTYALYYEKLRGVEAEPVYAEPWER